MIAAGAAASTSGYLFGGPSARAQQSTGIRSFDHVALPMQNTEAMVAFYRALGLRVNEGDRTCSVHFGDQKINFSPSRVMATGDVHAAGSRRAAALW